MKRAYHMASGWILLTPSRANVNWVFLGFYMPGKYKRLHNGMRDILTLWGDDE